MDAQGKDCDGHAERIDWTIGPAATHRIVENDTSAFKRKATTLPDGRRELRTVRPGFRQALAMLADGRADGLIAYDLDRAVRDPGGGGKRPFGFEPDGETVRLDEAAEIRRAVDAILAGVSLRQVTASLRSRNVPTVTGAAWSTITVRDMLLRPRNAGLMVYRPNGGRGPRAGRLYTDTDITGKAPWGEIIPDASWRAVRAILTDPSRRIGPGGTPRWLGSRIYRCGVCGDGTTMVVRGCTTRGRRYFRYSCRELSHLSRAAGPCDEYVEANVIAWLEKPESEKMLIAPDAGDKTAADLRGETTALRGC